MTTRVVFRPMMSAPRDGSPVWLLYRNWCGNGSSEEADEPLVVVGRWLVDEPEWGATWEHAFGTGDADGWLPLDALTLSYPGDALTPQGSEWG